MQESTNNRPNILMIMADQFRADWMSCEGTVPVNTPNIDKIAKNGIRFTNARCNSPLCAPSRASMTAGLYAHRTGVLDNMGNYPPDLPTVYQKLRQADYRVAGIGKTDLHKPDHFYGERGDLPLLYRLGFTDVHETEGKMNAAILSSDEITLWELERIDELKKKEIDMDRLVGPYQRHLRNRELLERFVHDYRTRMFEKPVWVSSESVLPPDDFHDGYIGRKACEFLDTVSEESPWHLFVSFVGPHDPWDAPTDYLDMYRSQEFPKSIIDESSNKPKWIKKKSAKQLNGMGDADLLYVKRHYAALISLIDHWIGEMMRVLTRRGLEKNTVTIFLSDHGEMMGDHGLFQKSVMYDPALRIPLIISDPRHNRSGVDESLVELVDIYPTLLDMAGVHFEQQLLDGKSLAGLISGTAGSRHKDYQISQLAHTRMIFDGRFKFIENYNDLNELYDLENDPNELDNIVEKEEPKVKEVLQVLREVTK